MNSPFMIVRYQMSEEKPAYLDTRWRVGSKVGRTIYAEVPGLDHDEQPLIGVMDTPDLATEAVTAHNKALMQRTIGR